MMTRNMFSNWLLWVVIYLISGSCQQLTDEVITEADKGTLEVNTRSAGNQEIIYPLTLFIFSENGDCIDTQAVKDKEEDIQLHLSEGFYRIVAVSACKDGYTMSSVKDMEDVIRLSGNEAAKIPLTMGKAEVTVNSKSKGKLLIELSNVVTAIDVSFSNIPSDVSEVVVTISPFYSSVNMKGEYGGEGYPLKFPCSLDDKGNWNTKSLYMFPGSGKKTVMSIWTKTKTGEEATYAYTWNSSPEANQPYHLSGNYSDGFALSGSFTLTAWNEALDIKFGFGAEASPDEDEKEGESEIDIPEIGSIWKGAIVADIVEEDESGADLLLLSLDEWDASTSLVKSVEESYTVNDISGWRLPTYEEAKLLQSSFSGDNRLELNELIAEYDASLYGIDGEARYLCNKSGTYYTFIFAYDRIISKAGTKKSYYVRLVKSYRIDF